MCEVTKRANVIRLEWTDVSNEAGYRVYRDGGLLATLPANSTTYTDDPPIGGPYTYAVEAYNNDSALPGATVEEEGCKDALAIGVPGPIVCVHSQTIMSRPAS